MKYTTEVNNNDVNDVNNILLEFGGRNNLLLNIGVSDFIIEDHCISFGFNNERIDFVSIYPNADKTFDMKFFKRDGRRKKLIIRVRGVKRPADCFEENTGLVLRTL